MDTDVEVLKSFNSLLNTRCILGMEEKEYVATSFMAFEKGHPLVKEFLKLYENIRFLDENGQINTGTNVTKLTNMLMEKGFVQENHYQELEEGIKIYPKDFFHHMTILIVIITLQKTVIVFIILQYHGCQKRAGKKELRNSYQKF